MRSLASWASCTTIWACFCAAERMSSEARCAASSVSFRMRSRSRCSSFSSSRRLTRVSNSALARASSSISSAMIPRKDSTSTGSKPFHFRVNSCFWISRGVSRDMRPPMVRSHHQPSRPTGRIKSLPRTASIKTIRRIKSTGEKSIPPVLLGGRIARKGRSSGLVARYRIWTIGLRGSGLTQEIKAAMMTSHLIRLRIANRRVTRPPANAPPTSFIVSPATKELGPDPHFGGALFDGDFEIMAHAHRDHWQRAAAPVRQAVANRDELTEIGTHLLRILGEGRNTHNTPKIQMGASDDRLGECQGVFGGDARFSRFVPEVQFHQDRERASLRSEQALQTRCKSFAV